MQRLEPDKNMQRFYFLGIQPTLFGEVSVLRNWGRIGTGGQIKVETFTHVDRAQRRYDQLVKAKCKRGYACVD